MTDRTGQRLGNYRLVRLLGRGGFAEVYLGEHLRLGTQSAIKILYTHIEGDDAEHFLSEARTIAHLIHPNIVRIFDFDVQDGVPFLVMDYAPNGNLRQRHPKGSRLALEAIVSYVKQVADALQYAHDEKLIHRDIKPENMLIGRRNEILLSDFGIALIAQSTRMQSTQEVVGTAYYMAPEQLQGKPRLASDQYALGVVVYEWLTGDRPFHGSFSEIASQHMFVPPPSMREKLPALSPSVEEVVITALAKDPHQRFGSVCAFATALEQVSKLAAAPAQPHLPPPTVAIPPASPAQPGRSAHTPTVTPPEHILTGTDAGVSLQQSGTSTPPPQVRSKLQPTPSPSPEPRSSRYYVPPPGTVGSVSPPITSAPGTSSARTISRRSVLIGLAVVGGIVVVGGSITGIVLSQIPAKPAQGTIILYTYKGHSSTVYSVAWSPDGQRIASGSDDNTVQVWNATDGSNVFTYTGHSSTVESVTWSPDGQRIASGSNDNTVQVWNAADGSNAFTYKGHSNRIYSRVYSVAWSPDGKRIASGSSDGTVQVWNAADGSNAFTYTGHSSTVVSVAWSPDGQRIASGSYDQTVQVWNAADGSNAFTYTGHTSYVQSVRWSPDGQRIASGSLDDTVQVWNATDGSNVFTYKGHTSTVESVAWSPDGQRIASGGDDGTVQVWNAADGSNAFTYKGHTSTVESVAWSPDGQHIASGSYDHTVQVWGAG